MYDQIVEKSSPQRIPPQGQPYEPLEVVETLHSASGNVVRVAGSEGTLEFLSPLAGVFAERRRERWILTLSSQYGCAIGCLFCDVPIAGTGLNCTERDIIGQVPSGLAMYPTVRGTERLDLRFARMGEPTWNPAVITSTDWLAEHLVDYNLRPALYTMLPKQNRNLKRFLHEWRALGEKHFDGNIGLHFSLHSTSELERKTIFNGKALTLSDTSKLLSELWSKKRKMTINLLAAELEICPKILVELFPPEFFNILRTRANPTGSATRNKISFLGEYNPAYIQERIDLIKAGYEFLDWCSPMGLPPTLVCGMGAVYYTDSTGKLLQD